MAILSFQVFILLPSDQQSSKALGQSVSFCTTWLSFSEYIVSFFLHFPAVRFGDRDLDLRLANPLHLRTLLEDKRFSKCRIVLLHASYPFSKEASYLASVYPQVKYLEFK